VEPVIIFEGVSKTYPLYHHITGGIKNLIFNLPKGLESIRNSKYEALHDISFEVLKGETLGIIGKNGAGKSTILGLIAGVLRPTKGSVIVRGRISPLLELGAGFHTELTGRENIVLKGVLIGLTRSEVLAKIGEIIDFSELEDFIDQPVRIYSSGMLARLGFSIVASLNPEILLIDEILAVGDSEFQGKCLERMAEFRESGVTMIFVSHSAEQVERTCDRVVWIEDHSVRMIGNALNIVASYVHDASI
jgi:lipopolysaccharide transport system ATP-binding protein